MSLTARSLTRSTRSALRLEKLAEEVAARLFHHATLNLEAVIEFLMPHQVPYTATHPRLLIVRTEHQTSDFGQHDGSGALRARLESDVQSGVFETVGPGRLEGRLDREQLGVGGGIATRDGFVVRPGQHGAIPGDHGPNGTASSRAGAVGSRRATFSLCAGASTAPFLETTPPTGPSSAAAARRASSSAASIPARSAGDSAGALRVTPARARRRRGSART